jgi:hypothetical protein
VAALWYITKSESLNLATNSLSFIHQNRGVNSQDSPNHSFLA